MKVQSSSMRKKQRSLENSSEITLLTVQKSLPREAGFLFLAGATGLEPNLPELHSGRSNQLLNVNTALLDF